MASKRKKRAGAAPIRTDALGRLYDALVSLEATRDGFEGLTGSLISAATNGLLNLMSSGDQRGPDAISSAGARTMRRAMQSKRYLQSTSLDLNGLVGEMARAQSNYIDIDCWIVATTKSLRGKEAEELAERATEYGWRFVSIDWSGNAGFLPRLAALCAAYPHSTLAHPQCAALVDELRQIRERPDFELTLGAVLHDLNAVDVSFAHMREAGFERLASAFSDSDNGRRVAGASPALLAQAPPVRRAAATASIINWWTGQTQTLALLGGEGMGKTWAALNAMRELASADDAPIPLIVTSHRARSFDDGLSALVADIVDVAAVGDVRPADPARFWRRRMERWAASQASCPPHILLLVDGLDENDPFAWDDWLASIRGSQWRSCVRLLLTCRKDDWERRTALRSTGHANAPATVSVEEIGRFEPAERDAYLASRSVDVEALSTVVLDLARHPRTAFHLTRLAAELPDMTRITREQLLLRDFESRWSIRDRGLRPDQFHDLVRTLARQAQDAVSRQRRFAVSEGAIVDAAASISGYDRTPMRSVLSELISGSWCQRREDEPGQIEFADAALPDAVGMALAADIVSMEASQAAAEISRFLEPWGADDLVEGVLRTCATVLITGLNVPDSLCSCVLDLWHGRPMIHAPASQDFWRRLHVFRPQLFLDFAGRRTGVHRWLVEWGLACLWEDHPDCRKGIEERIGVWLRVLPLPVEQHSDTPGYARRLNRDRRRQSLRLRVLPRGRPHNWFERLGAEEEPGAPDRIRLAISIVGFLPRTPFVGSLAQWALTMAAAGRLVHGVGAAALMRDYEVEDSSCIPALRAEAEALASDGTTLGRRAASHLLNLTGWPQDAVRAQDLAPRLSPAIVRFVVGGNGEVDFAPDTSGHDASRNLAALAPLAWRAQAMLASSVAQALHDDPLYVPLARLLARGKFNEEVATPLALRFGPAEAIEDLRRYLLKPPDLSEAGYSQREDYLRVAQLSAPILTRRERRAVADAMLRIFELDRSGLQAATAFQLFDLDFAAQVELLLDTPFDAWPADFILLLARAEPNVVNALLARLDFRHDASPDLRPAHLAEAATRFGLEPATTIDWRAGLTHPNATLRYVATTLARRCGVQDAAETLLERGWSADTEDADGIRFAGSELLLQVEDDHLSAALDRLDSENLLRVFAERERLRARAGALLLGRLRDWLLTPRKSRSFGARFTIYRDRQEHFASFYRERREMIVDVFRAAYAREDCRDNVHLADEPGLVWPLLTEMAADYPEFVDAAWRGAIEGRAMIRVVSLEKFPTLLPPGEVNDGMRREILRRAGDDEQLSEAVFWLQSSGHEPIVLGEVLRLLCEDRALDRARGYAIAGFLDATDSAIELWADERLADPGPGWLHDVRVRSATTFDEARDMRHWAQELAQAPDEITAWRAFWMLGRVCDRRYDGLKGQPPFRIDPLSFRAHWVRMQAHVWRSISTKRTRERKARLYHSMRDDFLYRDG